MRGVRADDYQDAKKMHAKRKIRIWQLPATQQPKIRLKTQIYKKNSKSLILQHRTTDFWPNDERRRLNIIDRMYSMYM